MFSLLVVVVMFIVIGSLVKNTRYEFGQPRAERSASERREAPRQESLTWAIVKAWIIISLIPLAVGTLFVIMMGGIGLFALL